MYTQLGLDKIMGFFISPDFIFSITYVSVMHFHNHLCMSISHKILKEIFANLLITDLPPTNQTTLSAKKNI